MKTVKFKVLPEKVQEFLVRAFVLKQSNPENGVLTNWLHTCPEWSKATDEERLAYAEWKYPKGTKVKAYNTNTNLNDFIVAGHFIHERFGVSCISNTNEARSLYRLSENRWAEIISEHEKEEPFTATNGGSLNEVEPPVRIPQAGELVLYRLSDWDKGAFSNVAVRYTGGMTESGKYIIENLGVAGDISCVEDIKLPEEKSIPPEDQRITNCPFVTCAINSGTGACVSRNRVQCNNIPEQFK